MKITMAMINAFLKQCTCCLIALKARMKFIFHLEIGLISSKFLTSLGHGKGMFILTSTKDRYKQHFMLYDINISGMHWKPETQLESGNWPNKEILFGDKETKFWNFLSVLIQI